VESVLREEESVMERICEAGRFYPGVKSEGLCFSSRFPAFCVLASCLLRKSWQLLGWQTVALRQLKKSTNTPPLGRIAFLWVDCVRLCVRLRVSHGVVKPRLHDTTCCQTGYQNRFDNRVNVCIQDRTGCGCIVYTNIQPVVKSM